VCPATIDCQDDIKSNNRITLPAASVSRKSVRKLRFNNAKEKNSAGVTGFVVFLR
jgi:hypothetical protein